MNVCKCNTKSILFVNTFAVSYHVLHNVSIHRGKEQIFLYSSTISKEKKHSCVITAVMINFIRNWEVLTSYSYEGLSYMPAEPSRKGQITQYLTCP